MTDEQQTPQAEQPPETQDAPPGSPAAPAAADADERERRKQAAAQLMAEPGAPSEAGGEPFTRGAWAGFERYQCRYCPWDTLHEALAWDHYSQRHGPGAQNDEED